jgi:hypothetical protein
MADGIRFKRGNAADRLTLSSGEPSLDQDSKQVWVGVGSGDSADDIPLAKIAPFTAQNLYVATTAFGGDGVAGAGRTGLELESGTATSGASGTALIDSGAAFTTALVGKAVFNTTDNTWGKVTAVPSSTQLTTGGHSIWAVNDVYIVCDAIDNVQEAFNLIVAPFNSATTIYISDGTFPEDIEFIGKTAGGAFTLTIQGSTSGTTTIDGETTIRQRIFFSNLTFIDRIFEFSGADVDWTTCIVTANRRGFIINKAPSVVANIFRSSSDVVFENDPGNYINVGSTVTIGYTIYTATPALGGDDSNDGLLVSRGVATSTTANKLVDSSGKFNTADYLGKTVYNINDDTWAEITAIDSASQVTLDTDIMVTGEAYRVAGAKATVQGGTDAIPGTNNCDVMVRISNGTFVENVTVQGKIYSGSFGITYQGTKNILDSLTATASSTTGGGAIQGTVDRSAGTWTGSARQHKWVRFTSGNNDGVSRAIDDNSTTLLTIVSIWVGAIGSDTYVVEELTTIIQPASSDCMSIKQLQVGITINDIDLEGSASGYGILAESDSSVEMNRCFSDPGIFTPGGSITTHDCVLIGGARFNRVAYAASGGELFIDSTKVGVNVAGSTAVLIAGVCTANIREGSILDGQGAATPQYGVLAEANTQFDCFASGSRNKVKNWGVAGLRGQTGAQGFLTTSGLYVDYSGNLADITVDALSSHIT